MEDTVPVALAVTRARPLSAYLLPLFAILVLILAAYVVMMHRELVAARSTLQAWQWQISDQAQHQVLADLRLSLLEARDPAYAGAKVVVSWNPHLHEGMIVTENLPAAPAGQVYQLWVLDPHEEAPISGGPIQTDPIARHFSVHELPTDLPGFAVSLEPEAGSPAPTGPILLALAPLP